MCVGRQMKKGRALKTATTSIKASEKQEKKINSEEKNNNPQISHPDRFKNSSGSGDFASHWATTRTTAILYQHHHNPLILSIIIKLIPNIRYPFSLPLRLGVVRRPLHIAIYTYTMAEATKKCHSLCSST